MDAISKILDSTFYPADADCGDLPLCALSWRRGVDRWRNFGPCSMRSRGRFLDSLQATWAASNEIESALQDIQGRPQPECVRLAPVWAHRRGAEFMSMSPGMIANPHGPPLEYEHQREVEYRSRTRRLRSEGTIVDGPEVVEFLASDRGVVHYAESASAGRRGLTSACTLRLPQMDGWRNKTENCSSSR